MSVVAVEPKKADATLTQLLTLVNVSASAPGKRKHSILDGQDGGVNGKRTPLNRRGSTSASASAITDIDASTQHDIPEEAAPQEDSVSAFGPSFEDCFSSTGPRAVLAEQYPTPDEGSPIVWSSSSTPGKAGATQSLLVPDLDILHGEIPDDQKVRAVVASSAQSGSRPSTPSYLRSYADLVDCTVTHANQSKWRDAVAAHVMDHVWSTRSTVTRNNQALARAAASEEPDVEEPDADLIRDQGFTRPKVLILAPFRNGAYAWEEALAANSRCKTIDSRVRFEKEYGVPEGVEDKLAQPAMKAKYPAEHIATFAGNIDDNFKLGMKLTRKTFKLFSGFYDSDIILSSPLGLRLLIDSDSADFLSSIELLILDQTEVMAMQNWEHVKFVLNKMNAIPQESHDTDFGRVKQWYLDNKSRYFRQTVVSAPYVIPEVLNLFNKNLLNLSGKRLITRETTPAMKLVRSGIRQTFVRFECADPQREPELRFNAFTNKLMPNLMRSAVSANHVLLFVPSYFDFLRVEQYLQGRDDLSFAAISEYSTTKQVTRAREAFFSGKKSILLLTERFHFYKRYRLRGAHTIVFYGLPDNPAIFSEVLEFPFNRKEGQRSVGPELEPNEVKVEALFCRYDLLKLRRIVGADAQTLLSEDKSMWKFS